MPSRLAAAFALAVLVAPPPGLAQTNVGAKVGAFVTVQPAGQSLASRFIGQPVVNDGGERIGNISDLLFDGSGRIVNVLIGVGGFLGIGEKSVAVPFTALSVAADANGKRVVKAALSRDQLKAAPAFRATEKTVYMRARDPNSETAKDKGH
jgi:sporulation protein YlmC with PRC-barrel domain